MDWELPCTRGARGGIDIGDAILQITAASSDMINIKLVGDMDVGKAKDIPHGTWKVNAIDGDQSVITIRLNSTLNSEEMFLTPGAVIHVTSVFPVYIDYGNLNDMRYDIVLQDFQIISRRPVSSDLKGPPK